MAQASKGRTVSHSNWRAAGIEESMDVSPRAQRPTSVGLEEVIS
jgi:hypothetical protein